MYGIITGSNLRINARVLYVLLIIRILSLASASAQKQWPLFYKPTGPAKIITIQKGNSEKPYIYHTKNFELRSLSALKIRELETFATTAESVPNVLKKIPLPLLGMPNKGRARVLIYPDEYSFIAGGGTKGAAGYYNGRMQAVLLREDTFLRAPSLAGSKLPPKADYSLLVHEFTHLCMHSNLAYLPPWFIEGAAEYLTAMHEVRGNYQFSNVPSSIRKRIKRCLPNDKDEIILPGIQETMALTPKMWNERIKTKLVEDHYRAYATSLLLVHTLFHGGEKRREATHKFLLARQQRPPEKDAESILIPVAERKKLEQRIIDYWHPRGLKIKFSSP